MALTMALATSYAYSSSESSEHKMRGLLQSIRSECLDPLPAGWMFISPASVWKPPTFLCQSDSTTCPWGALQDPPGELVARVEQLQLGQEIQRPRPALLSAPKSPLHQHPMENPNTSHCHPPGIHSCLELVRQGHFSPWHCTHST